MRLKIPKVFLFCLNSGSVILSIPMDIEKINVFADFDEFCGFLEIGHLENK